MIKFKTPSKKAHDEALASTQSEHQKAIEAARACLNDPKFKEFALTYQALEKKLIDSLIVYAQKEADPLRFAFGAKDIINRIEASRDLLKSVEIKAGEDV